MAVNDGGVPPILAQKHCAQPSALTPENLLREAHRQERSMGSGIPKICVLDPDGDIVRNLLAGGEARLEPGRTCYHTQLGDFEKGEADGSHDALQLIVIAGDRLRSRLLP